ncbi:MAG: DHH family phosphoesterase [Halodesulfurarchaeum sp.]
MTTESSSEPNVLPTVISLVDDCTMADVEPGEYYLATVNGVVEYGIFVDLSENVSGLVHESALDREYDLGEELVVELVDVRENGDVSFEPLDVEEYRIEERPASYDRTAVNNLDRRIGEHVHLEGEVVQIKQTPGPTIFAIRDETGTVPCTGFAGAGIRAHESVSVGEIVHVAGTVDTRDEGIQVEIETLERVEGEDASNIADRLEAATTKTATPESVSPLVDWPALEGMLPELEAVATRLRRAILEGQPIRIRHHADGDGMCAAAPVQLALERFVDRVYENPDATHHLLKRLPSKAPFYEMEDATRDLNYALGDRDRHGQKLPLLLMLDNGSTEEDTPAYRTLDHYDIPVIVIDHHHPDPEAVSPYVDTHVNPYLNGEDYRITTGMLSVELARMIAPDIEDQLEHVPAVAGLSDRSKAGAMDDYIDLATEAGYEEAHLRRIGEALDYLAYTLGYDAGRHVINDVLGIEPNSGNSHDRVVDFLAEKGREAIEWQLESADSHVVHERVANGAHLYRLDLEEFAHRFSYPAPGKTTGELHDRKVEATGEPVITIGFGPDFAVLRSDGVRLDIPEMVSALNEELPGAGVSGGGHLVVGSIRFVPGMREEVLDALIEKMAAAEIDEDLRSTLDR